MTEASHANPDVAQAAGKKRIVVVGAGIVGVATALHLQNAGHSVLVLDPSPPGTNTSMGNSGSISMGGVYPVSTPGNWKQVPKMLTDPITPLRIKWDHVLRNPRFFLRFLGESAERRVEANSKAMAAISGNAVDAHRTLIQLSKADGIVKPLGWLKVYSSQGRSTRPHTNERSWRGAASILRCSTPMNCASWSPV